MPIACLFPRIEIGALAAISAASSIEAASSCVVVDDVVDEADPLGALGATFRPVRKSSLVRGMPIVSMNRCRPVWP